MAEAFGVAAGVVGVLGLTIQITQIVVQFGLDWKDAPDHLKNFMTELYSLKLVLSVTRTNLMAPDFEAALAGHPSAILSQLGSEAISTSELTGILEACRQKMTFVLADLKKRGEGSQFGWRRFKEPFHFEDTRGVVETCHRQFAILNTMMAVDTLTLTASSNREIKAVREEQQAWHEEEKFQKVLNWLSILDFEQKQADVLSSHHPGTGEWLLGHDDFIAWKNGVSETPSVLWCPGDRKY